MGCVRLIADLRYNVALNIQLYNSKGDRQLFVPASVAGNVELVVDAVDIGLDSQMESLLVDFQSVELLVEVVVALHRPVRLVQQALTTISVPKTFLHYVSPLLPPHFHSARLLSL